MKRSLHIVLIGGALLAAVPAHATPSTTVWAEGTASIQGFLVPHVTYDTYFWKGVVAGAAGSPIYPVTTGLTMGVLPFDKVNMEVGFDLSLPSEDPLLLNAKIGTPEDALFAGSPAIGVGVMGIGTKDGATNYDVVYGQVQKSLPWGGFISVGGYYGAGAESLFTNSDGDVVRAGFMGGIAAPDIVLNLSWLKKIVLTADVQTGKNVFGAIGVAPSFYFTDTISLLTGPVFFLDGKAQPGGRDVLWTFQLDIDLPLRPAPPAAPPAATSASAK